MDVEFADKRRAWRSTPGTLEDSRQKSSPPTESDCGLSVKQWTSDLYQMKGQRFEKLKGRINDQ
jgi:hypothetical protein